MLLRIVTSSTAATEELEQELRRRGFEVETVSPGQQSELAVSAAIEVEELSLEVALQRASEIAMTDKISVLLAPRTVAEAVPPPKTEGQPDTGEQSEAPELSSSCTELQPALVSAMPDASTQPVLQEPQAHSEFQKLIVELEAVMPRLEDTGKGTDAPVELSVDELLSDWPIWQPAGDETQAASVQPPEPVPLATNSPATRYTMPPDAVVVRSRVSFWQSLRQQLPASERLFWRTATGTAAIAVMALLAIVLYHRFSPLPAQASPAAVQNEAAAHPGVAPTALAADSKPLIEKSATAPENLLKPAAIQANEVVAPETVVRQNKLAEHPLHPVKRLASASEVIAPDTVVRFHKQAIAAPAVSAQDGEIKHYSDLK